MDILQYADKGANVVLMIVFLLMFKHILQTANVASSVFTQITQRLNDIESSNIDANIEARAEYTEGMITL